MKGGITILAIFLFQLQYAFCQTDTVKNYFSCSIGICGFTSSNSNGNAGGAFVSMKHKKHTFYFLPFIGPSIRFSKSITDAVISNKYSLNGTMLSYRYFLKLPDLVNGKIYIENNLSYYFYRHKGVENYYSPLIEDEPFTSKRYILENTICAGFKIKHKNINASFSTGLGGAYIITKFEYPAENIVFKYVNYAGMFKFTLGYTLCK